MEDRSKMVSSAIGFHRQCDSRRSQDAFGRDRFDRGDRIRLCRRGSVGARSIGARHARSTRPRSVRLSEADGRAVSDLRDDDGDLSTGSRRSSRIARSQPRGGRIRLGMPGTVSLARRRGGSRPILADANASRPLARRRHGRRRAERDELDLSPVFRRTS